jgi:CIC family chloride channel protein
LFALEILYKRDVETEVFIPASITSITAYFTSAITLGTETIFPNPTLLMPTPPILMQAIPLGILAALVALAFIEAFERTNTLVKKVAGRLSMSHIAVIGGLIVGVIGLFYPGALGLEYDFIHKTTLAKLGELSLSTLIALLLFKIVATSITLNFGGSGGLFVPSLYVGGTLGLIYAQTLNIEPPTLCVVLAIAAMLAATNKTLLTSITLVAETVGPSFIIPTVISAAVSYFLSWGRSFYKNQLLSRKD